MKGLHKIELGAIPANLWVCFSYKDFKRGLKWMNLGDNEGEVDYPAWVSTWDVVENPTPIVMCIQKNKLKGGSRSQIAGVVAHEATHVMQFCAKAMSERSPGLEWQAYLVQTVTQHVLDLLGEIE